MLQKRFRQGEVIFSVGEPSAEAYLIVVGTVEIGVRSADGPITVSEIGPGEVFGEMGIIDPRPRSATAIAKTVVVCAVYEADRFLKLLESDPRETVAITKSLILRLREMNQKYAELLRQTAKGA